MNLPGVLRQRHEDLTKIRAFTERGKQRLDRGRPAAEWQFRFVNQPFERKNRFIASALHNVQERFGHRGFTGASATTQRLNGVSSVLEGDSRAVSIPGSRERGGKADERASMFWKQLERPFEHRHRLVRIL